MSAAVEYILPLRWRDDSGLEELTGYLRRLRGWADVTVVDGSEPELFEAHALAWSGLVRHLPVAVDHGANGKVRGVLTGIAFARHERLVLADDDVRYDRAALRAVVEGLDDAHLVKPQNFFAPLPWHARWDTGRILLNRAIASDYPGTYAVRRSAVSRCGGYDPDVLFENLELERTVRATGGTVRDRPDILVARRPPTTAHFLSQRRRQAYDSLAQPGRLAAELVILPALFALRRRPASLGLAAAGVVLLAERGRRRAGGRDCFPPSSALWTPLWLLERGVTSWLAVGTALRGGVRYGGRRIRVAAHSMRRLRALARRRQGA